MKFPNLKNEYILALDIETVDTDIEKLGPGPRRDGYILGVGIASKSKEWYFQWSEHLKKWLIEHLSEVQLIGHNILYDLDFLQYQGFFPKVRVYDTMHMEALLNESRETYTLNTLAKDYLNKEKLTDELQNWCNANGIKGNAYKNLDKIPSELVGKYCMEDCRLTYDIFQIQQKEIGKQELRNILCLESDLIPLLLKMRKKGVRIDQKYHEQLCTELNKKIQQKQKELNNLCGFEINVNATETIKKAFDKFGYKYFFTDKDNPSFTKSFLESHGSKLAQNIIELRHDLKMYSMYGPSLCDFMIGDRIHTEFNQLRSDNFGTVSGRFSSSRPNLQQVPKDDITIRRLFIPEPGEKWFKLDYKQEEMVIFAHYAQGKGAKKLRKMYIEDESADLYKIFASIALNKLIDNITKKERKRFKSISLGILYGMGTEKLGRLLDIITLPKPEGGTAAKYWKNVFAKREKYQGISQEEMPYLRQYLKAWQTLHDIHKAFPAMKETSKLAQSTAENRGYVKTILGRRRRFPNKKYCYKAFNAVDQGSGGDIMKKGMIDIYKKLGHIPLLTVHDELDFSFADDSKIKDIKEIMENTIKLNVPLRVDIERGENWGNCEK